MSWFDWATGWIKWDSSEIRKNESDIQALKNRVNTLEVKVNEMSKSLDDVISEVALEKTAIDSLVTLVAGLKQQLADALAGVVLSPATQAKIDEVFANVEANKQEIVDALNTTP